MTYWLINYCTQSCKTTKWVRGGGRMVVHAWSTDKNRTAVSAEWYKLERPSTLRDPKGCAEFLGSSMLARWEDR